MPKLVLDIEETLTEEEKQTRQPIHLKVEVASKAEAIERYIVFEKELFGKPHIKKIHTYDTEELILPETEPILEVAVTPKAGRIRAFIRGLFK